MSARETHVTSPCAHDEVVPVFPVHFEGWRTTITGTCATCGACDFAVWEAYGYGDAHDELPLPDEDEALESFEDWWEIFRFFLRDAALEGRLPARESPAPE